jgi:hypothetical protein
MIYSIAFNAKWSLKIKSLDYLRLRPPFGPELVWISQAIARSSIWCCWRVHDHHITFSDIK